MKKLFGDVFFSNALTKVMIGFIPIYLICGIVSYLCNSFGYINWITNRPLGNMEIGAITIVAMPMVMMFKLALNIIPILSGVTLFVIYINTFSGEKCKLQIIPKSNREKLVRELKLWGMAYGIYLFITVIGHLILSFSHININFIFVVGNLIIKWAIPIFVALAAIIMDMQCKNSSLGKAATVTWNSVSIVIASSLIYLPISLLSAVIESSIIIASIILMSLILEMYYILNKVNSLKIN